jgi:hypothetical protein
MNIVNIIAAIRTNKVNITQHAREEARNDGLIVDEILFATRQGEIIEDYPSDEPYPSCLVFGQTHAGEPLHTVWAYEAATQIAVLITVYRPDPERWENWKKRKK